MCRDVKQCKAMQSNLRQCVNKMWRNVPTPVYLPPPLLLNSEGRGLGAPSLRDVAVKFAGESGVGDGLRREWLSIVARQCLSLDHGLMESPDGGRTFQPSPHSNVHEGHLTYFSMMGTYCAVSLAAPRWWLAYRAVCVVHDDAGSARR